MTQSLDYLWPADCSFISTPPYFSSVRIPEFLETSLLQNGIVQPLCVISGLQGFYLVDGWKRFLFAQNHTIQIPVFQIAGNAQDHPDWFLLRYQLNLLGKSLSPLEKIFLLDLDDTQSDPLWYKKLSLPFKPGVVTFIHRVKSMPPAIWNALEHETIKLENLDWWNGFTDQEILLLVSCLGLLRFNLNQEKQFLSGLWYLKIRQKLTIDQMLIDFNLRNILEDKELTPPKRIERSLSVLNAAVYPHICAFKATAEQIVHQLNLPRNTSIQIKDHAEENELTCQFTFNSPEDFSRHLAVLSQVANHPSFSDLFGLVKGNQ
jgi:hypothetical protein